MENKRVLSIVIITMVLLNSIGLGQLVMATEMVEIEEEDLEENEELEDVGEQEDLKDENSEEKKDEEENSELEDLEKGEEEAEESGKDNKENKEEDLEEKEEDVEEKDEELEKYTEDIIVENVEELNEAIANTDGPNNIVLSGQSKWVIEDSIVINSKRVNKLNIDGNGRVITIKDKNPDSVTNLINIKNSNNICIKSMTLDGKGEVRTGIHTNGKFELSMEDIIIKHMTSNGVYLDSSTHLTLKNSTFESNDMMRSNGYEGGAIASKNYSGDMNIKNTFFESNINKTQGSNKYGSGGGAIAINMVRGGNINIDECYFNENMATSEGLETSKEKIPFGGGAVYIWNMDENSSIHINNSTFTNNIANDNGGAIFVQGAGSGNGEKIKDIFIENSTFYGNIAYGNYKDIKQKGGAIYVHGDVGGSGSLFIEAKIIGNTFYNNSVGNEENEASGAAIAGYNGGIFGFLGKTHTKIKLKNNNIVGNKLNNEDNKTDSINVAAGRSTYIEDIDNSNLGIDDQIKGKDVYGNIKVIPSRNHTKIRAGKKWGEFIPTIPIKPNGAADGSSKTNEGREKIDGLDQRGYERNNDFGAIEMTHIKYDSNGGEFKGLKKLEEYSGEKYYEIEKDNDSPEDYYEIFPNNEMAAISKVKVEKAGKKFSGWNTEKNGSGISYKKGDRVLLKDKDIILYAQWNESYKLTYHGNGHTDGIVPTNNKNYLQGESTNILSEGSMVKEDSRFLGWNTKQDGTGKMYNQYDKLVFEKSDVDLYAQWSIVLKYDGNGNTAGDVPIDVNEYKVGDEVQVKPSGDMIRDGYRFIGWKDQNENIYEAGEIFIIDKDITLTAIWEEIITGGGGGIRPIAPTPDVTTEPEDVDEEISPDIDLDNKIEKELNTTDRIPYISGYPDETVRPEANITREEVSTALFRLLDEDYRDSVRTTEHNFNDVKKGYWSEEAIATLAKAEIIDGYEDGTFRPKKHITRAEMVSLIFKISDLKEVEKNFKFEDIKGHWAEEFINAVSEKNWIEGYSDKTFRPDDNIKRAEFVTIMNKVLKRDLNEKILDSIKRDFKDLDKNEWYYYDIQEAVTISTG